MCKVKGCTFCKSGKNHYCKVCENTDSTHYSSMCPVKNAAILLFVKNKIVVVRDINSGKWMLPGGKIDAGESAWNSSVREYYEETGYHLPNEGFEYNYYDKKHQGGRYTRIYIGKTDLGCPRYKKTNETNALKCETLHNILNRDKHEYVGYVIKSLQEIFDLM